MRFVVVLMLLVSTAFAADRTGQFGLGGSLGWNTPIFGHKFNDVADAQYNWGLHARYHFNSKLGLELGYSRHEFNDVPAALKTTGLTALYRFNGASRFSPIAGLGLAHADFVDGQNWRSVYKALGGAEYDLTERLVLSGIADYQYVDGRFFGGGKYSVGSNPAHVLSARVALTFYFGEGCKDGSCHKKSEAPKSAPAPVVQDKDSDNDGVVDSKDKCPGTVAGVQVNAYGCAKEEKATVRLDVQFASGSTAVDSKYDAELATLAAFMKEHSNVKVSVEGHTDSTGKAASNKALSQKRAEAVRNALITKHGVEASRLTAVGHGSEQMIADDKTEEGRKQNRRVVAVISE